MIDKKQLYFYLLKMYFFENQKYNHSTYKKES